jgi:hypothetical protein
MLEERVAGMSDADMVTVEGRALSTNDYIQNDFFIDEDKSFKIQFKKNLKSAFVSSARKFGKNERQASFDDIMEESRQGQRQVGFDFTTTGRLDYSPDQQSPTAMGSHQKLYPDGRYQNVPPPSAQDVLKVKVQDLKNEVLSKATLIEKIHECFNKTDQSGNLRRGKAYFPRNHKSISLEFLQKILGGGKK